MKEENVVQEKSFNFAVRIVKVSKFLVREKKEFTLSKQLLRSGTSIGANIEESIGAYSTPDFLNKLSIAYKEARETRFWIRLLYATEYLKKEEASSLLKDVIEICRIISKIQLTIKQKPH